MEGLKLKSKMVELSTKIYPDKCLCAFEGICEKKREMEVEINKKKLALIKN